jgi:hypothetical protein
MALTILGTQTPTFTFPQSKQSSTTIQVALGTIAGTVDTSIALQSFDVEYINNTEFGFGRLQVDLKTSGSGDSWDAYCTVTLRDDTLDNRAWDGSVRAFVTFYGKS